MISLLLALIVLAGVVLLCEAADVAEWLLKPARVPRHPVGVVAALVGVAGLLGVGTLFVVAGLAALVGPVG